MSRRVAVVGAGHHGLVAAIRVAAAGCEVTVFEAGAEPGGGVRSAELTRPGFIHDTCAGFFPLAHASPVFRELELGVGWLNPPIAMVHVTDEHGGEIALHRELAATVASLEHCAPGAGAAWRDLVQALWPRRDALIGSVLGPMPPIRPVVRLLAGLRGKALELAPVALASSADLGAQLFGDDRASGWLAGSGAHADLSPESAGSAVFALGLNFLAHAVGWPVVRGGAGRLSEALVARLREHGGAVRCHAPVEAIELTGRRTSGVRLQGGDTFPADAVVCTVSPRVLLRLLPPSALPQRVERRLHGWRYSVGTLKLDWALSAPVPWSSPHAREAAVVHVGGPIQEITTSLSHARLGRFPERPALVVGQQSIADPTRAPAGRHTLYAYARVPPRSDLGEEGMVEAVERQLERFAPGFRSLVEARSIRPPTAIEAENPSMADGDLASGSCTLDQQLIFRPDPRLCRGRTPLNGLYVAGGWVHPGPGVHGVSGWRAAELLLRDWRWTSTLRSASRR